MVTAWLHGTTTPYISMTYYWYQSSSSHESFFNCLQLTRGHFRRESRNEARTSWRRSTAGALGATESRRKKNVERTEDNESLCDVLALELWILVRVHFIAIVGQSMEVWCSLPLLLTIIYCSLDYQGVMSSLSANLSTDLFAYIKWSAAALLILWYGALGRSLFSIKNSNIRFKNTLVISVKIIYVVAPVFKRNQIVQGRIL